MSKQIIPRPQTALSNQATLLLALGNKYDWDFKHLGNAPMPDRPIPVGDWLIVPAQQDTSLIPARALYRIQTIYRSGIRPANWVVIHEAPKLLGTPEQTQPRPAVWPYLAALGGLGVFLASTIITTAAIIDPILAAISPEPESAWIEIDRWF